MLYVDVKYINLISHHFEKFKKKNDYLWNVRCPFCGDSRKNHNKMRGYFFRKENNMIYKCHNCGFGASINTVLKELAPTTHKEYCLEKFGSNELTPHGMVNVYLNGKWLKMSPAFNATLCEKFNVEPLEFDGYTNSYLQQYNTQGDLFMEYLEDYGHFNDVPLKFMIENLKTHYPHIFKTETHITEFKI